MKRRAACFLAMAAMAGGGVVWPARAFAAAKSWFDGTANWAFPGGWTPFGVPVSGDDVFMSESDAVNRVITYNGTQPFVNHYHSAFVFGTGAGSITLSQIDDQFITDQLQIGRNGIFQQIFPGRASVNTATLQAGGVLTASGSFESVAGFTQFGGVASMSANSFVVDGSYTMFTGTLNGGLTCNGTFTFGGGTMAGGGLDPEFRNNGTFIYNSPNPANVNFFDNGALILNSLTASFLGLHGSGSFTLPAGHSLAVGTIGFTQQNGTFTQLGNVDARVGIFSNGVWDQEGGTLTLEDTLKIGGTGGATFLMGSGAQAIRNSNANFSIVVGPASSSGTFIQNGGSISSFGSLSLGDIDGGSGYYRLTGGGVGFGNILVSPQGAASGTFLQTGGFASCTTLTINQNSSSSAAVTLTGGEFSPGFMINNGVFTQTGGDCLALAFVSGAGSISISGTGSFEIGEYLRQDALFIGGSARIVKYHVSDLPYTHRVHTLSFEQSGNVVNGSWDLEISRLIIDYTGPSPVATIRRDLISGYADGAWNGTGLNSSTAAASASRNTALGYAESSQLFGPGGGVFEHLTVDNTAVLVKYTYYGDSNLDGQVDVTDLGALATHWQSTGDWFGGDFNYDGFVDVTDLGLLATNWQAGVGSPLGPGSLEAALAAVGLDGAAVPEPHASVLVVSGVLLTAWRGRQRRHS